MLSMKDSQVIVGLVVELPVLKSNPEYVTILPLWTGRRDSTTRRVFKAVDYETTLKNAADPMDFSRVLQNADIALATLWNESAFVIPEAVDVAQATA